jgi:putative exporter of polyketide antibiotics
VSPFEHVALLPLEEQSALPLVALSVLAAGVAVAALARFRQRDVG